MTKRERVYYLLGFFEALQPHLSKGIKNIIDYIDSTVERSEYNSLEYEIDRLNIKLGKERNKWRKTTGKH